MGIIPDALFSNLQEDLKCYLERDDMSGAASKAMVNSFYKKFVDREKPDAESNAFEKFRTINDRMATYGLDSMTEDAKEFYGTFKKVLWDFEARSGLGCLSYDHLFDRLRVGPGASVGARGGDFYTKVFDSELTCTRESLYTIYNRVSSRIPRWHYAEANRLASYGVRRVVEGNTLSFVPKTNDIKRSICTEPNINMMFQLSLGSYIEDALTRIYGIDLAIQPDKNRELAKIGSETGRFGTIDLESASDSLSLSILSDALDRPFMGLLKMLRSPTTSYRGSRLQLHMVSTMGNGFTFPLQTLIYSAVVIATARMREVPLTYPFGSRLGSFGVFGDDIIVERELYDDVVTNLTHLGFKVNSSKSFNEGPFRESCGHDYYLGVNIRGVYVKTLTSLQDTFVLVNRLNDWTARTGIPVRATMSYILNKVPFQPVPLGENDDAGIKVPFMFLRRYVRDRDCQSIRYKRWAARTVSLKFLWEHGGVGVPKGERTRLLNADAAYLSLLHGSLREYTIPIRHERVTYSRKTAITPNWDNLRHVQPDMLKLHCKKWRIAMGPGLFGQVGLTSLETAYSLNCED